MFLIYLLRALAGYVIFVAMGGFPERFINLCTAGRISVWDIRPQADTLYGKVRARDYARIRHCAKKSGVRLRIHKKCGLPFFLQRHKKHRGLLIGAVVFISVFTALSTRIWVIDIEAVCGIPPSTIRTALREEGVFEGMRTRAFNASKVEEALPLRVRDVQWIALNRQSSVLHVKLRRRIETQSKQVSDEPYHIVAAEDGVLLTLEPYEGKAMVRVPTAVEKGQLLISGITDNQDGSVCLHHAKGYTEAQTAADYTVNIRKKLTLPVVSGARTRVSVRLFSWQFPPVATHHKDGALFFSYDNTLTAGRYRLPISYTVCRNTFFGSVRTLTDAQVRLLALSDFEYHVARSFCHARILSQEIHVSQTQNTYSVSGQFRLLKNIAVEQKILLE